MSDTTHNTQPLNQAAGHDTGLYDASVHDNQIVALYNTAEDAGTARQMLEKSGFPSSSMQVLNRGDGSEGLHSDQNDEPKTSGEGLWGALRSLFVPDQDRNTFNTAISRGHVMLVVTPDQSMDRHHLIRVLEDTHPLDFDAKLEEWRQAGYDTTGEQSNPSRSNVETAGHATNSGLDTGARAGIDAGAQSARVMEERYQDRAGLREQPEGARRVRSYISQRPEAAPTQGSGSESPPSVQTGTNAETPAPDAASLTGTLPGNVASNPNATPGAATSGANSAKP